MSNDDPREIDTAAAQEGTQASTGQSTTFVYRGNRICFLYLKLYDDECEQILANTAYTIRNLAEDFELSGTTDEEGVLRHEHLPDDHYTITCGDSTELVESLFMSAMENFEGRPQLVRMSGYEVSQQSNGSGGA